MSATPPGALSPSTPHGALSPSTPHGALSPSKGDSPTTHQAISYCPYCAEETLFPVEGGGWECRSCLRAFSVKFLGLTSRGGH